jgi:hypothetical protein
MQIFQLPTHRRAFASATASTLIPPILRRVPDWYILREDQKRRDPKNRLSIGVTIDRGKLQSEYNHVYSVFSRRRHRNQHSTDVNINIDTNININIDIDTNNSIVINTNIDTDINLDKIMSR